MERKTPPPPFHLKFPFFFIHPLLVLNLQGFEVKLARKLIPSITKLFIPSQLLVILVFFQYYKCQFQVGLSWLAFFVPPEVISGRMVLLITLLLMLTHLGELLLPCNNGSGDDCGTNSQPGLTSPYQELLLRPRVLLTVPSLQLTSG